MASPGSGSPKMMSPKEDEALPPKEEDGQPEDGLTQVVIEEEQAMENIQMDYEEFLWVVGGCRNESDEDGDEVAETKECMDDDGKADEQVERDDEADAFQIATTILEAVTEEEEKEEKRSATEGGNAATDEQQVMEMSEKDEDVQIIKDQESGADEATAKKEPEVVTLDEADDLDTGR